MGHLRRLVVVAASVVAAVVALQWPLAALAQGGRLYVSVTDSKGAPQAGVAAADMTIEVTGKPAAVTSVTPATEPISIVVVTEGIGRDTISEIRRMMKAVVTGARAIHPDSRVGLMVEDGAAAPVMHHVTTGAAALDAAIVRFFESSRNAPLLDSILTASRTLALQSHTRRAIVAVTWGDEAPVDVMSPTKVAKAVRESGASLWALDLGGREAPLGTAEQRVLSDVTAVSGGRRERTTVASITPLTERIMATLRGQYAISFEDAFIAGTASPKVTMRTKGLKVLAPGWPAER